ncbi:ABC transporter permease subunit [Orbus sturtevantii]|uniref:ABC transporter permease subunit n=1 Tax=Orbus sturtevantii TaxID=3074109 RepID=UPI00370D5356
MLMRLNSLSRFALLFVGLFFCLVCIQGIVNILIQQSFSFFDLRNYIVAILIGLFITLIIDAILRKTATQIILLIVFSFLYIPMVVLIVYSFNASSSVGVWGGFSIKWYGSLIHNKELLTAVSYSLLIGVVSATGAVILGTLASFVLVRFKRFKGSKVFSFIASAPLVMPDVITGLALLLLFASIRSIFGWPNTGILTICIAHITFCTAYVIVVVSGRLRELDQSIEEAAQDLGAAPLKVFFIITLPMILPSLVSGWLLAFTLSLDDYVISNFVRGDIQTLPIVVWGYIKYINPDMNALASIIILIVAIIGFIAWLLMRRAEERKLREMRMANH